jgi:hypothetical protein
MGVVMVWARFSDDWADQPHIIALSASAFRAYAESVMYVARYTTDGVVPSEAVKARDKRAAKELERAGLWQKNGAGWYAPHWAEHVPAKSDLDKAREAAAERQRRRRRGDQ